MNTIQDLKWARLMMLIWAVLLVIVIGGYFGFRQLQKGTTLTNLVQDGLTQNSTFHAEVSAAPTILDKVKDKDIEAKKLDNSSLLYVFNETYENLEFSKKVKDETLANHFTDGKRKLVLFTSHPTTVANYSGVIELNSDWSAKLDNKVFSPRELKFQNTRLKGEYVSGIWFGLFSSEEAERLQKSTFPHAIKVKVKENKYLLVTEGIGEGTYGKTANVSLVDADAIPDDPNNQGAISAIIPGLTDADNKTWTIDERVGEIIYQSDGTVKINSHFTTPNATVKGVLNVRVVSQDKIEATVDHYGEVKCNDPVNFTLHNQDCVALPRDQTPAWKDDKIKELEKQIKEKEKEVKEKEKDSKKLEEIKKGGFLSYKCVQEVSLVPREIEWSKTWTFSFLDDEDCGYYEKIIWKRDGRTSRQYMTFNFYQSPKTTYLKDIEKCDNAWQEFVCYFKWNNPMKIKQLYFKVGSWNYTSKSYTARKSKDFYELRCYDIDPNDKKEFESDTSSNAYFNTSFSEYEWIYWMFQNWERTVWTNAIQSVRDVMKNFLPLSISIESYLKSLSSQNLTGDIDLFNKNWKFTFIWIMYWENKQVQPNFIWDTYVHKLWWYGSWPQAWKILDDENHKIWNTWVAKEVVCATKDSQGYLEANPERKNYWLIFKNNGKWSRIWNEHRLRYSNSQYDIASILLL